MRFWAKFGAERRSFSGPLCTSRRCSQLSGATTLRLLHFKLLRKLNCRFVHGTCKKVQVWNRTKRFQNVPNIFWFQEKCLKKVKTEEMFLKIMSKITSNLKIGLKSGESVLCQLQLAHEKNWVVASLRQLAKSSKVWNLKKKIWALFHDLLEWQFFGTEVNYGRTMEVILTQLVRNFFDPKGIFWRKPHGAILNEKNCPMMHENSHKL